MAVKTYKKGDATKLAPNFRAKEFDCCGSGCCNETLIDDQLVDYLQQIRDYFGKPVYLTGYRCPVHNAKTPNAAPKSRHTLGMAADFHIDGVAPAEIAKYAESVGVKGIGLYEGKDGNFVHIDTRDTKSFWYGHGQAYRSTFGGAPEDKRCTVELKVLKKGMEGEQVRAMQRLLNGKGYNCGNADGIFGTATDSALRAFQKSEDMIADGECGAKTWACLVGV